VKTSVTAFLAGLVFALGLGVSGMTRPIKVIGFLDFFGDWDPSLAFVMLGAVLVYFAAHRRSRTMRSPLLAAKFVVPARNEIDPSLVLGATLFGAGWGLAGFCPGPALVSLASGALPVGIFVTAMTAGIYLYAWLTAYGARRSDQLTMVVQTAPDS